MSQYVYLIYDYEEHGPDRIGSTLDRERLHELVDSVFGSRGNFYRQYSEASLTDLHRVLAEMLEQSDEALLNNGGRNHIEPGWSGPVLHVMRLA